MSMSLCYKWVLFTFTYFLVREVILTMQALYLVIKMFPIFACSGCESMARIPGMVWKLDEKADQFHHGDFMRSTSRLAVVTKSQQDLR